MDRKAFTSERAVVLRKQPSGYWAAIPVPLPPTIDPSWALFQKLSEADRALSELGGIARTLPNPHLLIRPFISKEAVLSSKIEGTQASLADLLIFEASDETDKRTSDVREVSNYVRALNYGLERLKEFPLSLRLLREMHEILMDQPSKTPGQFRTSQNWIGPPGCALDDAAFVPPPPDEMMQALSNLESFLHAKTDLPPLIRYAMVHYQFEAIHPFLDGNGRLGRLLATLLLCADPLEEPPLLPQPLLYLSAYFEKLRNKYYAGLLAVSQSGDWEGWIDFFLDAVIAQAKDARERSVELLDLMHAYRRRLQESKASSLTHQITERLFIDPVVSVTGLAKLFQRTHAGTQSAIDRLISLGILSEVTGRARRRLYACKDVLDILG